MAGPNGGRVNIQSAPTAKAVRDALIGFMAVLSQAEATKEAQRAGIAHAKGSAKKVYLRRKPSYTENQLSEVIRLIGEGKGVSEVAKQFGLSRAAIYGIQKRPDDALASISAWA